MSINGRRGVCTINSGWPVSKSLHVGMTVSRLSDQMQTHSGTSVLDICTAADNVKL
jgi:hypothetical protein